MESNYFFGTDTYGRHINVGIDVAGNQFYRSWEYNGYGKSWSKWQLMEDRCNIETRNGNIQLKWGWSYLDGCTNNRMRLPKYI